jgi:hypothetical protein
MANPRHRQATFLNKTLWSAVWLSLLGLGICLPVRGVVAPPADSVAQERRELLDHNWDPGKLYAILNSSNVEASENLYRAAFSAGPSIIPKLQAALKDDRTAEFAAQSLAYLGGQRALDILAKLVDDPRNLDLRRFYYGALGEPDDPRNIGILLNKIRTSDQEPDRSVTQDAILALSISSDLSLVPKLRQVESKVTDPVIQDDINTAATVIELRAKYLEKPEGKSAGKSVTQVIRTYFMPALEGPPVGSPPEAASEHAQVRVKSLTFSPNKTRGLAYVNFETPEAVAHYRMVLQKHQGAWILASVWLGQELERAPQTSQQPPEPK